MVAVLFRLRAGLRRRWRATVGMTVLVGIVISVPLAVAAGARRTDTAPDRFERSSSVTFDANIVQVEPRTPRTAEVAALRGVSAVESYTFVFGGLLRPDAPEPLDALVFTGSFAAGGLRLVEGRVPDPASSSEFVATRSFAAAQHASPGDQFQLITLTQEQAAANGFSDLHPEGPTVDARLVGIVDGPSELDSPTPLAFFDDGLRGLGDIGLSQTDMAVTLRPGTSLDELRAEVDTLPQPDDFSVAPTEVITPTIRRAVEAQGKGLWLLAGVAAIAAIAVLGQLLGRQARLPAAERDALAALGYSDLDRFAEGIGRASIPILVGTLMAVGIAVVPSRLFPTSFARRLEPSPGVRIDAVVLSTGSIAAVVALGAWTALSLFRGRRTDSATISRVVDTIATRVGSPTMSAGMRLAFATRRRDRGSVVASQFAALLIVAGTAGALVFGASLNRLVREPARYGSNYDFVIGDQGAETFPPGLTDRLHADPSITALTAYAVDHVRAGSTTIELLGIEQLVGDSAPQVSNGRLPRSDNEVAFGRIEADRVGARVGRPITLSGPSAPRDYIVTGIVVVPGLGPNDGLGQGAVMTLSGLRQIDATAGITSEVVRVEDSRESLAHLTEMAGAPPSGPFRPGAITNVARVRAIPFVVAAFLLVLGSVTLTHITLTTSKARRRDLAVLRALGADEGWIGRALHWQATCGALSAALLGPPLGFGVGRAVFGAFADSMGAVHAATAPALPLTALVSVLLVVVNVCAVPGWLRARSLRPAAVLHVE